MKYLMAFILMSLLKACRWTFQLPFLILTHICVKMESSSALEARCHIGARRCVTTCVLPPKHYLQRSTQRKLKTLEECMGHNGRLWCHFCKPTQVQVHVGPLSAQRVQQDASLSSIASFVTNNDWMINNYCKPVDRKGVRVVILTSLSQCLRSFCCEQTCRYHERCQVQEWQRQTSLSYWLTSPSSHLWTIWYSTFVWGLEGRSWRLQTRSTILKNRVNPHQKSSDVPYGTFNIVCHLYISS